MTGTGGTGAAETRDVKLAVIQLKKRLAETTALAARYKKTAARLQQLAVERSKQSKILQLRLEKVSQRQRGDERLKEGYLAQKARLAALQQKLEDTSHSAQQQAQHYESQLAELRQAFEASGGGPVGQLTEARGQLEEQLAEAEARGLFLEKRLGELQEELRARPHPSEIEDLERALLENQELVSEYSGLLQVREDELQQLRLQADRAQQALQALQQVPSEHSQLVDSMQEQLAGLHEQLELAQSRAELAEKDTQSQLESWNRERTSLLEQLQQEQVQRSDLAQWLRTSVETLELWLGEQQVREGPLRSQLARAEDELGVWKARWEELLQESLQRQEWSQQAVLLLEQRLAQQMLVQHELSQLTQQQERLSGVSWQALEKLESALLSAEDQRQELLGQLQRLQEGSQEQLDHLARQLEEAGQQLRSTQWQLGQEQQRRLGLEQDLQFHQQATLHLEEQRAREEWQRQQELHQVGHALLEAQARIDQLEAERDSLQLVLEWSQEANWGLERTLHASSLGGLDRDQELVLLAEHIAQLERSLEQERQQRALRVAWEEQLRQQQALTQEQLLNLRQQNLELESALQQERTQPKAWVLEALHELESQLAEGQLRQLRAQAREENLQHELQQLGQQTLLLEQQLQQQRQRLEDGQADLVQLASQLASERQARLQAQEYIQSLEEQLSEGVAQLEDLEERLNQEQREQLGLQRQLFELQSALASREQESAEEVELQAQKMFQARQAMARQEEALEGLRAEKQALLEALHSLEERLHRSHLDGVEAELGLTSCLQPAVEFLELRLAGSEGQEQLLGVKAQDFLQELQGLARQVVDFEDQLSRQGEELASSRLRLQEMERQLGLEREALAENRAYTAELEEQLADQSVRQDDLEDELKQERRLRQELEQLQQAGAEQVTLLQRKVEAYRAKLLQARDAIATQRLAIQEAQQERDHWQASSGKQEELRQEAERALQEKLAHVDRLQSELSTLHEERESLFEEVSELLGKVQGLEERTQDQENDRQRLQGALEALAVALETSQGQEQELRRELEQSRSEHLSVQQALQLQLQQLEEELGQSRQKLQLVHQRYLDLKNAYLQQQGHKKELDQEILAAQEALQELLASLEATEAQRDRWKQQSQLLESEKEHWHQALGLQEEWLTRAEESRLQLLAGLESGQHQLIHLQARQTEVEEQLQKSRQTLETRDLELADLAEEVERLSNLEFELRELQLRFDREQERSTGLQLELEDEQKARLMQGQEMSSLQQQNLEQSLELERREERLHKLEQAVQTLAGRLRETHGQLQKTLQRLEQSQSDAQAVMEELEAEIQQKEDLEKQLQQQKVRLQALERDLQAARQQKETLENQLSGAADEAEKLKEVARQQALKTQLKESELQQVQLELGRLQQQLEQERGEHNQRLDLLGMQGQIELEALRLRVQELEEEERNKQERVRTLEEQLELSSAILGEAEQQMSELEAFVAREGERQREQVQRLEREKADLMRQLQPGGAQEAARKLEDYRAKLAQAVQALKAERQKNLEQSDGQQQLQRLKAQLEESQTYARELEEANLELNEQIQDLLESQSS